MRRGDTNARDRDLQGTGGRGRPLSSEGDDALSLQKAEGSFFGVERRESLLYTGIWVNAIESRTHRR
jgi:hypothetical protein